MDNEYTKNSPVEPLEGFVDPLDPSAEIEPLLEDSVEVRGVDSNEPPRKKSETGHAMLTKFADDPKLVEVYREEATAILSGAETRRDILELEIDELAECIAIATQIYKQFPIPDNAYQLASLTNAHNSSLTQLEKMKDPKQIAKEIEDLIKGMFTGIYRGLTLEIDKTKKELHSIYPQEKTTIDELFSKIFTAVSPDAQNLYDGLQAKLKKILGIKK